MVPVNGTRAYVNALNLVARRKQRTMSDLVREALDARYGIELEQAEVFFAESGTQNHHSEHSPTTSVTQEIKVVQA